MIKILVPLSILCLIGCALLTKYFSALFIKKNIVDIPSTRRAHQAATPRGGGVAIVISFAICFIMFDYIYNESLVISIKLLTPLFLVSSISLLDDISFVPIIYRGISHLIAATAAAFYFLWPNTLLHNEVSQHLDFFLACMSFAAFINIYNFMDGIDGITALQSIHLSVTLLLLCYLRYNIIPHSDVIVAIGCLVCASSMSFLYFNWHPARIFLGDVGSISLGFLIGIALLLVASSGPRLFAATFISSLYYIADGGLTILIRLVNGEKIWLPHLKHFFQQGVRKGMSHKEVATKIALCNICLMCLSISSLYYPAISIILAFGIVTITLNCFSLKS